MKKRLYSAAVFIAILALAFVLKMVVPVGGNYFFDAAVLFIACVASIETSKMFAKMGKYNHRLIALIAPFFIMLSLLLGINFQETFGVVYTILLAVATIALVSVVSFVCSLIFKRHTINEMEIRKLGMNICKFALIKAFNTLVVMVYPAFMIMFLTLINHIGDFATFNVGNNISLFILVFAFIIPIISDTFAYIVGGLIGGKKLAPKISPNKTVAGAVGGLVFCVIISVVLFFIFNAIPSMTAPLAAAGITVWKVAIISLIGSVLGQLGDLFESYLKRSAGVKDSGKIMPGHGGLLDRFDSHLFVAPFVFLAFCILLIV